jgi:hypothetical protein
MEAAEEASIVMSIVNSYSLPAIAYLQVTGNTYSVFERL